MGKEGKRLRRCSTSTDVIEVDHAKPLKKGKRKLDTLDTKVIRKKKKSENKQSDLELKLKQKKQKTQNKKQIDLGNNVLEQKTQEKKSENKPIETGRHPIAKLIEANNWRSSVSVRGYDPALSRDDIQSALAKHFGSCGKLTRFHVCMKNGYVHIDMNPEAARKALTLNGSLLAGRSLEVRMARDTDEYDPVFVMNRCYAAFTYTCGGRYLPSRLVQAFKTKISGL